MTRAHEIPEQISWRHNAPDIPGMPLTDDQVAWVRRIRPKDARTPLPSIGDTVLVRMHAHGELIEAEVIEIIIDETDANTHQYVVPDPSREPLTDAFGRRLRQLTADPWMDVKLKIIDQHGAVAYVVTKEAKLPGSPGWLPLGSKG